MSVWKMMKQEEGSKEIKTKLKISCEYPKVKIKE
jgi:hypothetical protein